MIDNNKVSEINKQKVQYFFENKIPVHVIKVTGVWLNGNITEISALFFILDDFEDGPVPVFFSEIEANGVNKYKEKEA